MRIIACWMFGVHTRGDKVGYKGQWRIRGHAACAGRPRRNSASSGTGASAGSETSQDRGQKSGARNAIRLGTANVHRFTGACSAGCALGVCAAASNTTTIAGNCSGTSAATATYSRGGHERRDHSGWN